MINIKNTYILINLIFFLIISLIFIYSFVFAQSGSYPISSECENFSGFCVSKGLSRAFSQIITGNTQRALQLNPYSFRIFYFFALQLIFRLAVSVFYLKYKKIFIIKIDVFISILLFVYAFAPFFFVFFNAVVKLLFSV